MKRKYFIIITLTLIIESAFCQYKIPLYTPGNAAGFSNGFNSSILSVTGQNVSGEASDADNKVYLGLLAPVRYVLTDANSTVFNSATLYQNYPNPFKQQTTISFEISKPEKVKLSVFDILGQHVDLLIDQDFLPGKHLVIFKAENVKPGLYFYRLETTDFWATKNMILTN